MSTPTTRCREFREGRVGRFHTYKCRNCGDKFQVFLSPGIGLHPKDRVCPFCNGEKATKIMREIEGNEEVK